MNKSYQSLKKFAEETVDVSKGPAGQVRGGDYVPSPSGGVVKNVVDPSVASPAPGPTATRPADPYAMTDSNTERMLQSLSSLLDTIINADNSFDYAAKQMAKSYKELIDNYLSGAQKPRHDNDHGFDKQLEIILQQLEKLDLVESPYDNTYKEAMEICRRNTVKANLMVKKIETLSEEEEKDMHAAQILVERISTLAHTLKILNYNKTYSIGYLKHYIDSYKNPKQQPGLRGWRTLQLHYNEVMADLQKEIDSTVNKKLGQGASSVFLNEDVPGNLDEMVRLLKRNLKIVDSIRANRSKPVTPSSRSEKGDAGVGNRGVGGTGGTGGAGVGGGKGGNASTEQDKTKMKVGDKVIAQSQTPNAVVEMKEAPDHKSKKVTDIPHAGLVVIVQGPKGDWYNVKYQNHSGWVNKNSLTAVKDTSSIRTSQIPIGDSPNDSPNDSQKVENAEWVHYGLSKKHLTADESNTEGSQIKDSNGNDIIIFKLPQSNLRDHPEYFKRYYKVKAVSTKNNVSELIPLNAEALKHLVGNRMKYVEKFKDSAIYEIDKSFSVSGNDTFVLADLMDGAKTVLDETGTIKLPAGYPSNYDQAAEIMGNDPSLAEFKPGKTPQDAGIVIKNKNNPNVWSLRVYYYRDGGIYFQDPNDTTKTHHIRAEPASKQLINAISTIPTKSLANVTKGATVIDDISHGTLTFFQEKNVDQMFALIKNDAKKYILDNTATEDIALPTDAAKSYAEALNSPGSKIYPDNQTVTNDKYMLFGRHIAYLKNGKIYIPTNNESGGKHIQGQVPNKDALETADEKSITGYSVVESSKSLPQDAVLLTDKDGKKIGDTCNGKYILFVTTEKHPIKYALPRSMYVDYKIMHPTENATGRTPDVKGAAGAGYFDSVLAQGDWAVKKATYAKAYKLGLKNAYKQDDNLLQSAKKLALQNASSILEHLGDLTYAMPGFQAGLQMAQGKIPDTKYMMPMSKSTWWSGYDKRYDLSKQEVYWDIYEDKSAGPDTPRFWKWPATKQATLNLDRHFNKLASIIDNINKY